MNSIYASATSSLSPLYDAGASVVSTISNQVTDVILPELAKHKTIVLVASVAIAIFASLVFIYQYYSDSSSQSTPGASTATKGKPSKGVDSSSTGKKRSSSSSDDEDVKDDPKKPSTPSSAATGTTSWKKVIVTSSSSSDEDSDDDSTPASSSPIFPTTWSHTPASHTPASHISSKTSASRPPYVMPPLDQLEMNINELDDQILSAKMTLNELEREEEKLKEEITKQEEADKASESEGEVSSSAGDSEDSLDLSELKKKLAEKQEEIQTQKDIIIAPLEEALKDCLKKYPNELSDYLIGQFTKFPSPRQWEIYGHLAILSAFAKEERFGKDEDFVLDSLRKVDDFLTRIFFTSPTEACIPEKKKIHLVGLHPVLKMVNRHFDLLEKKEPDLALRLKIKLANIPVADAIDRTKYNKVFLTESQQVDILVDHFQKREDAQIDKVIDYIKTNRLTEKDVKRLSKFVVKKETYIDDDGDLLEKNISYLSDDNIDRLRKALLSKMGRTAPLNWGDREMVQKELKAHFNPTFNPTPSSWKSSQGYDEDLELKQEIVKLHRISKAKTFFEGQVGLPEDEIQALRWYHATNYKNFDPIIDSNIIKRLHQQAFYGAWVSNQREHGMGRANGTFDCSKSSVFIFKHRITELDPNVVIEYEEQGGRATRWRGITTTDIPLYDTAANLSNVSIVGLYKGAPKSEKEDIAQKLRDKNINVQIVSVAQIDFMQKEYIKVIGNPNLSDKWWGKADPKSLEYKKTG